MESNYIQRVNIFSFHYLTIIKHSVRWGSLNMWSNWASAIAPPGTSVLRLVPVPKTNELTLFDWWRKFPALTSTIPVCETWQNSVFAEILLQYILYSSGVCQRPRMPSTHDWINNPLDVVEGMFGKRETPELHSLTAILKTREPS